MNEFFIEKSLRTNSGHLETLNTHLNDLKGLINGDLAKNASIDLQAVSYNLKAVSDQISKDMAALQVNLLDRADQLSLAQLAFNNSVRKLNRLIWQGKIVVTLAAILLCYIAYRVH